MYTTRRPPLGDLPRAVATVPIVGRPTDRCRYRSSLFNIAGIVIGSRRYTILNRGHVENPTSTRGAQS
jgi:hypothetical protein